MKKVIIRNSVSEVIEAVIWDGHVHYVFISKRHVCQKYGPIYKCWTKHSNHFWLNESELLPIR